MEGWSWADGRRGSEQRQRRRGGQPRWWQVGGGARVGRGRVLPRNGKEQKCSAGPGRAGGTASWRATSAHARRGGDPTAPAIQVLRAGPDGVMERRVRGEGGRAASLPWGEEGAACRGLRGVPAQQGLACLRWPGRRPGGPAGRGTPEGGAAAVAGAVRPGSHRKVQPAGGTHGAAAMHRWRGTL